MLYNIHIVIYSVVVQLQLCVTISVFGGVYVGLLGGERETRNMIMCAQIDYKV